MKETLTDAEFGTVQVRRIATAKYVRIRVAAGGVLVVTAPHRARMREVTALLNGARDKLRSLVAEHGEKHPSWQHGSQIGDNHRLEIIPDERISLIKSFSKNGIISVRYPRGATSEAIQNKVYDAIHKTLRSEAKRQLPERLAALAQQFDFHYDRLRFSNAGGRWGSCSSSGTISLNIWLMSLPDQLIDYVMIHELSHTRHMNHSQDFWRTVGACMPDYLKAKRSLSTYSPHN